MHARCLFCHCGACALVDVLDDSAVVERLGVSSEAPLATDKKQNAPFVFPPNGAWLEKYVNAREELMKGKKK